MKKAVDEDEMPMEIDFSKAERGRYAGRIDEGVRMVMIEPDITEFFPDSEAVNAALRMVLRAGVLAAGEAVQQRQRSKVS
jgi:hypothetical protein